MYLHTLYVAKITAVRFIIIIIMQVYVSVITLRSFTVAAA